MVKEVQHPLRVLGQPLCPHGMGDSWHFSFHSQCLPAAGSPQPCAWCIAPRIQRWALPHAGAVVWSEPLPQSRANPFSTELAAAPPAQAAWSHVPCSSLWLALYCLPPAQRSCKQSRKDETGAETWNRAEV